MAWLKRLRHGTQSVGPASQVVGGVACADTRGGVAPLVVRRHAARFTGWRVSRVHADVMTASLTNRQSRQASAVHDRDARALERAGLRPVPAELGQVPLQLVVSEGQLQVHTAPYRGSFSSVLSQAMRAAGLGSRVLISQFLKGGVQQGPLGQVKLCGGLTWMRPDVPACLNGSDDPSCRDAVQAVWSVCRQHLLQGDLDQLVLDEIGLAIGFGLIEESELISALEQRPGSMDVIITGPAIPPRVVAMADQVTELRRGF